MQTDVHATAGWRSQGNDGGQRKPASAEPPAPVKFYVRLGFKLGLCYDAASLETGGRALLIRAVQLYRATKVESRMRIGIKYRIGIWIKIRFGSRMGIVVCD